LPKTPPPIQAGSIEIDARIDLHGLTQAAAHDRLSSFLRRSAADGLRTVLVITGKGGSRSGAPALDYSRDAEETGVLRRSVPRWLAEPPLRGLVISCQSAAARHGGDGAYYVGLRRQKRTKGR
jgi:DNA-nicking Smr family endonuclease